MRKINKVEILRPKVLDGMKGFVNAHNDLVIAPEYEDVDVFREGLCWVKRDGNWGLINKNGECLIEPRFEDAREFNLGYANVKNQGKWGVVDRNGKMIFQPEFDLIRTFKDGVATVVKGEKSGFIDIKNQRVIEPIYEDVHDFSEGLAAVKSNGQWGFINLNGEMAIEPQFLKVGVDFGEYGEGWACVEKLGSDENEYGFIPMVSARIDHHGIASEPWMEEDSDNQDDWSFEDDPWKLFGIRTSVGFMDTEGEWAIRPKFQEAESFRDGVAVVRIDNKWGLIEKSGAYLVEPEFDLVRRFEDGCYYFEKGNEVAYTDRNFDVIPNPFENKASKECFLDSILKDGSEGEALRKQEPVEASNDYKIVRIGYNSAVVDKDNNVVIKDDFETIGQIISLSEGMARTQKGDYFGIVNCRKREYLDPVFNYIWNYSEGLGAVRVAENQEERKVNQT